MRRRERIAERAQLQAVTLHARDVECERAFTSNSQVRQSLTISRVAVGSGGYVGGIQLPGALQTVQHKGTNAQIPTAGRNANAICLVIRTTDQEGRSNPGFRELSAAQDAIEIRIAAHSSEQPFLYVDSALQDGQSVAANRTALLPGSLADRARLLFGTTHEERTPRHEGLISRDITIWNTVSTVVDWGFLTHTESANGLFPHSLV